MYMRMLLRSLAWTIRRGPHEIRERLPSCLALFLQEIMRRRSRLLERNYSSQTGKARELKIHLRFQRTRGFIRICPTKNFRLCEIPNAAWAILRLSKEI